jgi:hypothetical protein
LSSSVARRRPAALFSRHGTAHCSPKRKSRKLSETAFLLYRYRFCRKCRESRFRKKGNQGILERVWEALLSARSHCVLAPLIQPRLYNPQLNDKP